MVESNAHPNILFVMCDQLSALATSPYGNVEALTPNLGDLATNGVVFENSYCSAPLCAPSRASMLTGRLPSRIPVNDNAEELPASAATFVHHLRRGGYKTILSGKMHFIGPDQLHGFEERLTTDIYPADFIWTQDWTSLGDPPRDPEEEALGRYMAQMVKEAGPIASGTQIEYDEEVQARALERLRRLARRRTDDQGQPWFLCVSYTQPHDPYAPSQVYWDRYQGVAITLPEAAPRDATECVWDGWVNAYHGVDLIRPTPDDIYRVRRGYYGMTSYIDAKLGELISELDRLGFLRNTLVVFTSDHGDMVGEHGMFFKRTFREWSSRVPLVMAGPGVARGHRVKENVSLVDLYPTLLEIAGQALPDLSFVHDIEGRSLAPLLREKTKGNGRSGTVIMEYNGEGVISPTRVVIQGRLKFVCTYGQPDLLFDLAVDPQEWHSLVGKRGYEGRVEALRRRCFEGWDPEGLNGRIHASQELRQFLREALFAGHYTPWDFRPEADASRMYVRRDYPAQATRASLNQWDPSAGGG